MNTKPEAPKSQVVTYVCECGSKRQARMNHYDICTCGKCGAMWWALRPLRNGPLVGFLHPGFYSAETMSAARRAA